LAQARLELNSRSCPTQPQRSIRLCIMATRACLAVFVCLAAGAAATRVTPVQKVTELLKKLQGQITEEGKKEAAQYDKYSCFCKEQADEKQYAIEKSTKLEKELGVKIDKLDGELSNLATEISELGTSITSKESEHERLTTARADEHEVYLEAKKNLTSGISAVEGALETLKSAKGDLTDAKLTSALVQVRAFAGRLAPQKLALLARSGKPGDAAKYQYHSNSIVGMLEDLLDTFKSNLKDMDEAEFKSKAEYDAAALGLTNEVKFQTKDKAEKEAINAAKTSEKEAAEEDKTMEEKDRKADSIFLSELTEDCQKKAELFDSRSTTRSDELTAIAGAIEQLTTVANPKYAANSKLVGLQKSVKPHRAERTLKSVSAPLLLQLRGVRSGKGSEAVSKVQAFLAEASGRLQSGILTSAAIKVLASKDHFVKVRQLIKDLIAKLEADAASEADQKSTCDTNMKAAMESRDKANANIEKAASAIAILEADIDKLKSEIADLTQQISDDRKALAEATELRTEEQANNEKTIADATEGKDAAELALKLLEDFYSAQSSLLQKASYVPPNADRDGNALEDVRPEIFDSEYKGQQTDAKGIIGILQVIVSDFDRTMTTTTSNDKDAAGDFKKQEKELNDNIAASETSKGAKKTSVVNKESDLKDKESDKATNEKLLESALSTLEKLKVSCVDGEETFADRKKKREEEIAALKEAMQILIDWQS